METEANMEVKLESMKMVAKKTLFGKTEESTENIIIQVIPKELVGRVVLAGVCFSRQKSISVNSKYDGNIFVSVTCPCFAEQIDDCLDFVVDKVKSRLKYESENIVKSES